ncbi:TonB family protein [Altererythrobacter sp. BO-6]|uniref:energy transducer TonB n=1 Tax=Altererythrobacter sp. BO-6 TaxID=2604537 RepID=UPI0013E1A9CB|nr:TonB family protein [Altererythrobacter sp. BO-6]QIG54624.1 TonB family protein [Altererythrobacter sp. BO-6]
MFEILVAIAAAGDVPLRPPISTSPNGVQYEQQFVAWVPGELNCDGAAQPAPLVLHRPMGVLAWRTQSDVAPVTLSFTLDDTGRPLSIALTEGNQRNAPVPDLMPSLAASRFKSVGAPVKCSLTYTHQAASLADAPLSELLRRDGYTATRQWPRELRERVATGDCRSSPRPLPLMRVYPDFRAVAEEAGTRGWLTLSYDIDPAGVPENLRIVASSGNAGLEQEAMAAIAKSRFRDGPRTVCVASFGKGAEIIAAPDAPEEEDFGASPAACDVDDRWSAPPRLSYPPAYLRREIEGWAIVRYDVATWGEIGNIEVLDSQPTEEFGKSAFTMLQRAKFKPMEQGITGCIDRVFYRMKRNTSDAEEGESDEG